MKLYRKELFKNRVLAEEDKFSVLSDYSFHIKIKKEKIGALTKVDCVFPYVNLRLNPFIYSQLIEIGNCFQMEQSGDVIGRTLPKKSIIMKKSPKNGNLKMRTVKGWVKYLAILSEGYLYFYERNAQPFPSTYFCVKDCEIIDGENKLGIQNCLIVISNYTDFSFSLLASMQ